MTSWDTDVENSNAITAITPNGNTTYTISSIGNGHAYYLQLVASTKTNFAMPIPCICVTIVLGPERLQILPSEVSRQMFHG